MTVYARVTRGQQSGEFLTPHKYEDGMFVLSPTKYTDDYIRVKTEEEFIEGVKKGLGGRMSSPRVRGPRFFASSSIVINK